MTGMTDISPAAVAAREAARTHTGQFGAQEHSAPELGLDSGPFLAYEPGQPIRATVEFHDYADHRDDEPQTIERQAVDIASILDTMPLDQVKELRDDPYAFSDDIVYELQSQGALTQGYMPFGPLELDAGDIEAYYDYRELRGLTDPIAETATPAVSNLAAVARARRDDIDKLRQQIAELEAEKEQAEERVIRQIFADVHPNAATAVVQIDHHRHPVEVYNAAGDWLNIGEDEEQRLVAEITKHLGADPAVVGGRGTARVVELQRP